MNKNIKKLWIKALKSGEFKQGVGFLEKDGKYCALGILSLLALVEGICTYKEERGVGGFDNKRFNLSFNVMKWAGIAQDDERFLDPEEHKVLLTVRNTKTSILELNDSGKSLKEIAMFVEKYL